MGLDSNFECLSTGEEMLDPGINAPKTLLKTENDGAGISEEPFATEGMVRGSISIFLTLSFSLSIFPPVSAASSAAFGSFVLIKLNPSLLSFSSDETSNGISKPLTFFPPPIPSVNGRHFGHSSGTCCMRGSFSILGQRMAFVSVLLVLLFENRGEEKGQGGVCAMRAWFEVAR